MELSEKTSSSPFCWKQVGWGGGGGGGGGERMVLERESVTYL